MTLQTPPPGSGKTPIDPASGELPSALPGNARPARPSLAAAATAAAHTFEGLKPPPLPQRWVPWVVALLILGALGAALTFWQPGPPRKLVMSTGQPNGGYAAFGAQYKAALAKNGIELELRVSDGAVDNLQRLVDPKSGVDVALFQGGLPQIPGSENLMSLGHMFYEPIWLFTNGPKPLTDLRSLRGKRIAVGAQGSGTHVSAMTLLKTYGMDEAPTELYEYTGSVAADALRNEMVDAAFFVASPQAPIIVELLSDSHIHLTSFVRAEALARHAPHLTRITMPAGVVVPAKDLPPHDATLLATTALLLARKDLHPVLIDLLIEAAKEVHGQGSILSRPGEFPNANPSAFALSQEAERFYKEGPGLFRRYLPLAHAIWAQRLLFIALPALAILGPILHFAPIVWRWHMRRRIYRWYGELRAIEDAVVSNRGDVKEQMRRLYFIDRQLQHMGTPLAFTSDLYSLRAHLHFVHDLLEERIGEMSRQRLSASM